MGVPRFGQFFIRAPVRDGCASWRSIPTLRERSVAARKRAAEFPIAGRHYRARAVLGARKRPAERCVLTSPRAMASAPEPAPRDADRTRRHLALLTLAALAVRAAFLLLEP